MKAARALGLVLLTAGRVAAGDGDIVLPGNDAPPIRIRVEVAVDGRPADAAWEAFLDKLFDYFDRDGDGVLSAAEAARLFPLPLPGGRSAAMDFAKLDADRDGKGTRAEFKAFYRSVGFTPVVVAAAAPPEERIRLGDELFRHLDRDGDGALSRAELDNAPALLRRFDENEDEVLTATELLAVESAGRPHAESERSNVVPADDRSPLGAILHVMLGKEAKSTRLESRRPDVRPDNKSSDAFLRFVVPGGRVTVGPSATGPGDGFRTAKAFFLAQFRDAVGSVGATKATLERNPDLNVFVGLFDVADRDGNETLTVAELGAFLDLVELGVGCQTAIATEDRGHNLFDLLDESHDGRLDLGELNRAASALGNAARGPVRRIDIPRQVRLTIARGSTGPKFGPLPIPAAKARAAVAPTAQVRGPRWFRSMDRNGDGFVSPAEFLGPPELFRKLDAGGDGRISLDEAIRADPNNSKDKPAARR